MSVVRAGERGRGFIAILRNTEMDIKKKVSQNKQIKFQFNSNQSHTGKGKAFFFWERAVRKGFLYRTVGLHLRCAQPFSKEREAHTVTVTREMSLTKTLCHYSF